MTHRPAAALGRQIVTRWRLLAERRLEHLTDLRESGRWRRYYSEAAFAADLRDAELAVAAWRLLAPPKAADAAPPDAGEETRTTLPPVAFLPHDLPHDIAAERHLRQA